MGLCKWEACRALLPSDQWQGYCQPAHAIAHAAHVRRKAIQAYQAEVKKRSAKQNKKAQRLIICARCGTFLVGNQRKFCSDVCRNWQQQHTEEPLTTPCARCKYGEASEHAVNGWQCRPGLRLRCKPDTEMTFYDAK